MLQLNSLFSCRPRDHCSVYTAELQALKQVYQSKEKKFMIFSDSLSALQVLKNFKIDHPLLIQIQELLHKINANKKETVFMWVPGHIGIRGNETADRAAKEALNTEPMAGLIPFSSLKPLTSKYVCEVWQGNGIKLVWYQISFMKFYQGFQANFYLFVTRKENTVLNRLHIGHSYLTHSFILGKEETPVCVACNTALTIKHDKVPKGAQIVGEHFNSQ